jgi:hypothetical protein
MLLWTNLKVSDIMKAAVMVIVTLVVMQIMIIGEDIVSLVSSTEFWKTSSWAMGLILVPLINSSKQKLTYRVYHDLDYTEIPDSNVDFIEISVNPLLVDGWISKYKIKTIMDVTMDADTYFVCLPKFDSKDYENANNNNWGSDVAYALCQTWMRGAHQTDLLYSDTRPYAFYYDATDASDYRVKSATVDVMKWMEKGESFKHRIAYGADGTLSAGSIQIYAEYTHVIANYNDRRKTNPDKSNTFMSIAWNGTATDAVTFNFNSGLRLIATEVYVTNLAANESIIIGKNLAGTTALAVSSDSVNDVQTMPEDNQLIKIDGTMRDYPARGLGEAASMSYYHKHPIYYHKGESMTILYYNEAADMNMTMTSQVLYNYQDQHVITHKDTFNSPNTQDAEIFLRIPTDMYIESIETEIVALESGTIIDALQGELYIYGIKHENFAVDTTRGAHLNNATGSFEGLMQGNILDTLMFGLAADGKVGQASSYCSPMDYFPQGSIIRYVFDGGSGVVDTMNLMTQIKGRNARKQNNRDALQFWRNDPSVHSLNGGA